MIVKKLILIFFVLLAALPQQAHAGDKPPRYDEVMEIIKPLEYSGLHCILPVDVSLSVDAKNKTWTLRNIRTYDEQGNVLLAEGRYGLCAELAFHAYRRVKNLLGDNYLIKFARVAESDFFDTPESNHVVLLIVDRAGNQGYLLDPSFHAYDQNFEPKKYTFYGVKDSLADFEEKNRDIVFSLDSAFPLLVKKNALIVLTVEPLDGKFDRQNLTLSVLAKRRSSSRGHYLFVVRTRDGKTKTFGNQRATRRLLTREEESLIGNKLLTWVKTLAAENPEATNPAT